jgi:hypothetical protein
MKRFTQFVMALAITSIMSSCSIELPVTATSNEIGDKVGRAKATVYLRVLSFGQDASIRTAAENGNISEVSTVDIKQTDVLGIIQTYETIVTGE